MKGAMFTLVFVFTRRSSNLKDKLAMAKTWRDGLHAPLFKFMPTRLSGAIPTMAVL
jgi:hypothetical protein